MPDDTTKQKLIALGTIIKGRELTSQESTALFAKADSSKPRTKVGVETVLAESLATNAETVHVKLAAHDDSDRLIDQIVTALGK